MLRAAWIRDEIVKEPLEITPQLLLSAYAQGVFPMAESRDNTDLNWYEPRLRGVLPLDAFHISTSLKKAIRRNDYTVRINSDFAGTVAACAARDETWINAGLTTLYATLHGAGYAHSLEIWRGTAEDGSGAEQMVGGLFGVSLGGAFFGESMFSTPAIRPKSRWPIWCIGCARRGSCSAIRNSSHRIWRASVGLRSPARPTARSSHKRLPCKPPSPRRRSRHLKRFSRITP